MDRKIILLLTAGAFAVATPAKANLIIDGDFEDTTQWGAWTFDATAAGGGSGPAYYNYGIRDATDSFGHGGPDNGAYVGGLDWTPGAVSLSQAISGLVVGTQYALNFELNLRDPEVPVTNSFLVQVDGATIFLGGDPFAYSGSYVPISTSFIASNSTSTIIAFIGQFDSDTAYNIDNVTLQAVPEPVSASLLLIAGAAMLIRRRRNQLGDSREP